MSDLPEDTAVVSGLRKLEGGLAGSARAQLAGRPAPRILGTQFRVQKDIPGEDWPQAQGQWREKPLDKQRSHLGRKTAPDINQTGPVFPGIFQF